MAFGRSGIARIYQAKESLAKYGIDEGDFFYLDLSHHGDHVEVFHGFKNSAQALWRTAKTVVNSDGTTNLRKQMEALGYRLTEGKWVFAKDLFRTILNYV